MKNLHILVMRGLQISLVPGARDALKAGQCPARHGLLCAAGSENSFRDKYERYTRQGAGNSDVRGTALTAVAVKMPRAA
jgi:hypothetical protein